MKSNSNISTAGSFLGEKQEQVRRQESVLNQFDLKPIKDIDPILVSGYKEAYSLRIPFLLKFLNRQDEGQQSNATIEYFGIRLLTKLNLWLVNKKGKTGQGSSQRVDKFTIEVTSENDLFFYYFHTLDQEGYEFLKQSQALDGTFQQYLNSTQSYLEKCDSEPQRYACIMSIKPDQTAYLQIIQTLNFKDVEVLRFDMIAGDEDIIRQHVSYKYGAKRSCQNLVDGRIKDVTELVKLKNPQLLLHIQKILETSSAAQQQANMAVSQAINKQYVSQIMASQTFETGQKRL